MTKLKNVFLLAAMAVSAVTFTACDKENEDENNNNNTLPTDTTSTQPTVFVIKASNVSTGTVEVDSVKVVFWSNMRQEEYVIASAPYNGGFTLNLPETVDDGYLDDWENSVKRIEAYKSGSYVGQFWYADKIDPEPTKWTIWMYANKADEIEGLLVKQGWSKLYWSKGDSEMSTTEPSGLKWFFVPK